MSMKNDVKDVQFDCGKILLTINNASKQKSYALTCSYCGYSAPYMNNFVQHLEDVHHDNIDALIIQNNDINELATLENDTIETCSTSQTKPTEDPLTIDIKNETNIHSEESMDFDCVDVNIEIDDIKESSSTDDDDDDDNDEDEISEKDSNDSEIDEFNKAIPTDEIKLLCEIIKLYESQPLLWNTNNKNNTNRSKREDAFKKITKSINKKFDGSIDWKIICKHINKLRHKFRIELRKLDDIKTNGKKYKPPWYYEKLLFLKDHLRLKCSIVKEKHKLPKVTKYGHTLKEMTDEQILKFIEIYKSFPILWDIENIEYRFRQVHRMHMNKFLIRVNDEMKLQLTLIDLKTKVKAIRAIAIERKQLQIKNSNTHKIDGKFYKDIDFLIENVQPFHCDCGENFQYNDSYKIHAAQHNNTNPFNCTNCSRSFTNASNYTDHLRSHIKSFECTVCTKRFSTRTKQVKHMRCHTGEKPYFCELCGKSFRTAQNMRRHVWRHKKIKKYKCRLCDNAYYDNGRLRDHMNSHLNLRNNVCKICDKTFTSMKYLRQHELIHAEKKRYVCNICGKAFAQYAGLSGHLKSHGVQSVHSSTDGIVVS